MTGRRHTNQCRPCCRMSLLGYTCSRWSRPGATWQLNSLHRRLGEAGSSTGAGAASSARLAAKAYRRPRLRFASDRRCRDSWSPWARCAHRKPPPGGVSTAELELRVRGGPNASAAFHHCTGPASGAHAARSRRRRAACCWAPRGWSKPPARRFVVVARVQQRVARWNRGLVPSRFTSTATRNALGVRRGGCSSTAFGSSGAARAAAAATPPPALASGHFVTTAASSAQPLCRCCSEALARLAASAGCPKSVMYCEAARTLHSRSVQTLCSRIPLQVWQPTAQPKARLRQARARRDAYAGHQEREACGVSCARGASKADLENRAALRPRRRDRRCC